MRATLFVLQTLHFAFSQRVEIVDTPSHIYFGMGQALDFWVLVRGVHEIFRKGILTGRDPMF